jgi:hypothetical protein
LPALLAIALLYVGAPVLAQAAPPPDAGAPADDVVTTLTPALRAQLVDAVAARLIEHYVDEAQARRIAAHLRERLQAHAYDTLASPAQFAEQLTHDLRDVNGDLHLGLHYDPRPRAVRQQLPTPGAAAVASAPAAGPSSQVLDSQRQNYGITRVEILEGNVGYLELSGFDGNDGFEAAYVDALRLLSHTDAVIVDLRRNGGGSGETSHFLFSHFLSATPVATISIASRETPTPQVMHSLAEVPGPRRPDVPLYVLTSRNTVSAAEEFSFVLANQKRATLVGSRTAGAGHMVAEVAVGHGFELGVSITRVSDPVSGREWEGNGVTPTLAVAPKQALLEAHLAAVRTIAAKATDPDRRRVLEREAQFLEAQRTPQAVDPALARRLVGIYQGREVSLQGGQLAYTRVVDGLPQPLVWLGGLRFAQGPTQFVFGEADGQATMTVELPNGVQVRLVRGA